MPLAGVRVATGVRHSALAVALAVPKLAAVLVAIRVGPGALAVGLAPAISLAGVCGACHAGGFLSCGVVSKRRQAGNASHASITVCSPLGMFASV